MTTLYISVRTKVVESNKTNGTHEPPFDVRIAKDDTHPRHVFGLEFDATKVRLVYDRGSPLVSGAVCWLEIDE